MQRVQIEAANIVSKVVYEGRNLTQVLGETMRRQSSFTAQEKGALQDLCYGTLRFYSRFRQMLDSLLERPLKESRLGFLLLVAMYQLQHTKVGHHAIVDQAVRAAKIMSPTAGGLVNAILRNFLRKQTALLQAADQNEESCYSYPHWWIDAVKEQYGDQAKTILESGNQHPPMTLRVNTKHTDVAEYQELLAAQDILTHRVETVAITLERPIGVERLPNFSEGWVSVQDAGAQHAARILDVQDGMRVLDACAAPGGKTAHLLELANITLIALDKDEERLRRVRENLQRTQVNAQLVCGDAANSAEWWDGQLFDRILADVPCSASGVVRRHPDIKWLRRPEDIEKFAIQQEQILESLWSLLAGNGKLLYATCSIFGRENRQTISTFLSRHPEAKEVEIDSVPDMLQGQLLPNDEHDGFFYALLRKQT
jgi:16S rRNA (cytosine967-C5)-methyltransferase